MEAEDHEARISALRHALAKPDVKDELRTRLERLLRLATERAVIHGALAKRRAKQRAGSAGASG